MKKLALLGITAIAITACGAVPDNTVPQAATPVAVVAPVTVPVTAAPVTAPSDTTLLAGWYAVSGQKDVNILKADMATIGTAATGGDVPGLTSACEELVTDAATAMNDPAIPVASYNVHWQAAISDLHLGAEDCVVGTKTTDPSLITNFGHYLEAATEEFKAATPS